MGSALVSICIPTYNYAEFVGEAIASACSQSYENLEILVSDNCSTDETPSIVEKLAAHDRRIRYHRNEHNLGMQGNFNRCLELAQGEYIKLLCADDLLMPQCVERMVEAATRDDNVALVACSREIVDDRQNRLGVSSYSAQAQTLPGSEVISRCFFRGNLIGEPSAVLFRKSVASQGFSDVYKQVIDMEMWFRLLETGSFAFIPEALCRMRQHRGRATFAHIETGIIAEDRMRLFRDFSGKPYIRGGLRQKLLWDLRMAWLLGRERATAKEYRRSGARESVYFPNLLAPLVLIARVAAVFGFAPDAR
jgi:glycosyltransferase involved in cell wall biosynthesis